MVNTPRQAARRIAATLYAYSLLDDLVLLYPVYALLFADTGLSVWQITSLFVIWSGSSLVLEVPSGIWADTVSRRLLLVLGPLLTAIAFAAWVAFPSYWVFALGFLLWGLKGALASGALEALVYEELERNNAEDRYGTIMGRASAAGTIGVVLAMALAAPALALGGYTAVGVASVVVSLLTAAVAAAFPEGKPIGDARGGGSFTETLRAGTLEVKRVPAVRSALVVVAVVTAIWGALEEYTPLLILGTGVPVAGVPLFELLIWAGVAAGGLLTGRAEKLGPIGFGVLLAASAAVLAAAALVRHPAAMVAVAVAFGGFQLSTVLADVRLQHAITGPARATVTSLAGMTTDVATIAVYGCYAVLATASGHQGAFALLCIPYLVLAVRLVRAGRATRSPAGPAPSASSPPSAATAPAGSPVPAREP